MATAKLKQSDIAVMRERHKAAQGDRYRQKIIKKVDGKVFLDKEGQTVQEDDYSRHAHYWEFGLYFQDNGVWDVYDTLTQLDPTGEYVAKMFETEVGRMNDHIYPGTNITIMIKGDLQLSGCEIHFEIWHRAC